MALVSTSTIPFLLLLALMPFLVSAAQRTATDRGSPNSVHHTSSSSSSSFSSRRSGKLADQFDNKYDADQNEARREASKKRSDEIDRARDSHRGLMLLNSLVMESFIEPTFMLNTGSGSQRTGKRRTFSEIPSAVGRVLRGLTNLTVTIGRTINSENVNGSLSRLITSRLVGVSESLMGWVERSVDDLPSIPRLDAQECMKRTICEAHNQPKKYGAVGLVLQLFFPPYLDAENATKVVSKYQLAARYGRTDNANCSVQFDGCMVNILDVLQGALNMVM